MRASRSPVVAITGPDAFQIVKFTHLWSKQVDNNISQINQYPVRIRQTFQFWGSSGLVLDMPGQMVGQSADMSCRAAGCYDHDICQRGFLGEIDNRYILGFIVFQRSGDNVAKRIYLGDAGRAGSGSVCL